MLGLTIGQDRINSLVREGFLDPLTIVDLLTYEYYLIEKLISKLVNLLEKLLKHLSLYS